MTAYIIVEIDTTGRRADGGVPQAHAGAGSPSSAASSSCAAATARASKAAGPRARGRCWNSPTAPRPSAPRFSHSRGVQARPRDAVRRLATPGGDPRLTAIMLETRGAEPAAYRAVGTLYNALMTGAGPRRWCRGAARTRRANTSSAISATSTSRSSSRACRSLGRRGPADAPA